MGVEGLCPRASLPRRACTQDETTGVKWRFPYMPPCLMRICPRVPPSPRSFARILLRPFAPRTVLALHLQGGGGCDDWCVCRARARPFVASWVETFSYAFGALAVRQLDSSHVLFEEVRINPSNPGSAARVTRWKQEPDVVSLMMYIRV